MFHVIRLLSNNQSRNNLNDISLVAHQISRSLHEDREALCAIADDRRRNYYFITVIPAKSMEDKLSCYNTHRRIPFCLSSFNTTMKKLYMIHHNMYR